MKAALVLLAGCTLLAQSPVKVEYACPPEDIDGFGLSCSPEDPCPVFLELTSADSAAARILVSGNLHTERTTLYSILLASEDGGKTWTEPLKRIRAASLEQIQFFDTSTGWISGQVIEPLPKDPFMLLTSDGGKTWRQKPLFEESRFGSVAQFWFESKTAGELVIDHASKHEVFQTNTGGESWEVKEVTTEPVRLKGRRDESVWRLRADGKTFHLERRGSPAWEPVAQFAIHVADCK
ncbi:MAG: hypothetical protein LAO79_06180 [Acidobacteriia bacterium]|nr:hypothetical protein [Terriglobia bacterium]